MSEPVAAIDCGTNTIRLLVGAMPDVEVRESRIVRLGQGVDATGRLSDAALARTFGALDDYAATIREHGATRVRLCATSAVRDAANGEVFVRGVEERLGVSPDILTGAEEAALAFDGAVRNLTGPAPEPVLVIDIGGGSTELVLGSGDRTVEAAHSMDIGSVRLHERHLHRDPPTGSEVAACVADIEAHLDAAPVPIGDARTVVGVAGSNLTIAAGVLDLPGYDRAAIDQARLATPDVAAYVERLVAMTVDERRALPYMNPGRADVIGAGALILVRVLARAHVATMVASESDILDGIAWSLVS
ncbi:MAG TPA: Ppx/GppA phosphatase family protein [Nocardioides sp.]|uniref:Ppx/GppA phosphatase family protein n=1 Tax=Nocardioides sp. TaxID=35761 RepID=UPI002E363465|nr:Ppx/GppA phosphatase family protein [Nocardioides sp.]HEX5088527.1 Ppx/GppA phosphatase family protein [Nocardioides sp.]